MPLRLFLCQHKHLNSKELDWSDFFYVPDSTSKITWQRKVIMHLFSLAYLQEPSILALSSTVIASFHYKLQHKDHTRRCCSINNNSLPRKKYYY